MSKDTRSHYDELAHKHAVSRPSALRLRRERQRLRSGRRWVVTDKLFTGQRQIADVGIYHYGARFYLPKLGRFLSADTIVPGYANPQNLNRFSYVTNNPLRYIDPTGHRQCEEYQGGCLSEKQVTKQYESEKRRLKEESRRRKHEEESEGGPEINLPAPTLTEPSPAAGGANDDCLSDPYACEVGDPTILSSGSSGPNWGKVASGVGIILAVDLLIVAPIAVGAVLSWEIVTPVLAEAVLTETPWVMVMGAAIIGVHAYGLKLIKEGAQGH